MKFFCETIAADFVLSPPPAPPNLLQIELVINPRSCCTLLFDKMTSSIDKSFLIFLNTNEKFFPEVLRVFSAVSENFPLKISKQLKFLYSITFFSIFEYEFSKSLRYEDKDEKWILDKFSYRLLDQEKVSQNILENKDKLQ